MKKHTPSLYFSQRLSKILFLKCALQLQDMTYKSVIFLLFLFIKLKCVSISHDITSLRSNYNDKSICMLYLLS